MTNETEIIKIFISKYWNIPINGLNQETKLEDDLGITGDDAVDFFDKFSKGFNIDLSGLNLRRYFEGEGVGLINFSWFFGKRKKVKRSSHEITIADLTNALKFGKWIDPVEQKPQ
ncbi:MAG TPA: DUF1493 family protein [Puia sp.]|nr:DUF1493 family protein [Puia sp.]